ncbi:MAG: outer membrane lipoprotein chaperone LolA [Gammaproteobacteria bacterium]
MFRALALAVLLFVGSPAHADETAIARLGELLGAMRQVEGSFTQRLLDDKGALLQESRGRVELAHPGRFRWETQAPFSQLVVSDGTTVWQFDPDLLQVVVRALDRRADQIPSMLLAGEIDAVKAQYEISAGVDTGGLERFLLIPRAAGGPFARLSLAFHDGRLSLLEMSDGLGQRTEVAFPELRPLATPDPARFRFETPPGVDEIRDE